MRIYIAGPMTGHPDGNRPAFGAAEQALRDAGYEPVNPANFATERDFRLSESLGMGFLEHPRYKELVTQCLRTLVGCDGICTLLGYQNSRGASAEVAYGRVLNIPIQPLDWWLDKPIPVLRWTGDPECAPTKSYPGDAGFDLVVEQDVVIRPGDFFDVPLGIAVELPPGTWAMLTGRSSTIRRRRILVTQGIIDNGFRGPLYAGCQNVGREMVRVKRGERIAQLILFPLVEPRSMQVTRLSDSERGEAGFGSSGA